MNKCRGRIGAGETGRGLGPFGCTNFGSSQCASRVGLEGAKLGLGYLGLGIEMERAILGL